jgi:hypothetical protein
MSYLRLARLWTDSDGMVQVEVQATTTEWRATQDLYTYPDDLASFAEALETFPTGPNAEARFEYGKENGEVHSHVLLRAFLLNGRGHSAFEIKTNNNKKEPHKAVAHFFMPCEVATVNRIGKELRTWSQNMATPLQVEWTDA